MHPGNKTIEYRGVNVKITIEYDHGAEPPWVNNDGHGDTRWIRPNQDKTPGEVIIYKNRDGKLVYDFQSAMKTAKAEGWGEVREGETAGQRAERVVRADMEYLRGWANEDWYYLGYTIETDIPGMEDMGDSLWGIESTAIDDYLKEAVEHVKERIDKEIAERIDAACRGIVTH